MIERKDIQGAIIFIDYDRGEIHFSDKPNIIRLTPAFGQYQGTGEPFSEPPFGIFRVPGTLSGQECTDDQIIEEHHEEPASQYEPDEVFCNAIDDTTIKKIIKNKFEPSETKDAQDNYNDILASDNIQSIADNIENSTYAEVLLYLTPRKLMGKDQISKNIDCSQNILNDLITYGFLKENHRGELFFTFKGLIVRSELTKICNQKNLEIQPQPILA